MPIRRSRKRRSRSSKRVRSRRYMGKKTIRRRSKSRRSPKNRSRKRSIRRSRHRYRMKSPLTRKQKRRSRLTKRQELNRKAKPEITYYNVHDIPQPHKSESWINKIKRNPMVISPLKMRLDSLMSLGIGMATKGLPLRTLKQLIISGYIAARHLGFDNPLDIYLQSEIKHDIHDHCRLSWIAKPKRANDTVKQLYDTKHFEIKRSKTGGIMDVRPRENMLRKMKDTKQWLSYLTQLKSDTDTAQKNNLFQVLSGLIGDNQEKQSQLDWFDSDVVNKLPLALVDRDWPYPTRPATSKDREYFRNIIDMDCDIRKQIYNDFIDIDFTQKIYFNQSHNMWAGISLSDDNEIFNIVHEWLINESMFNRLIPVKDGKQLILPSFKLRWGNIPSERWKPSRDEINNILPTVYKYMRLNGRCQFGLSMYLNGRDAGHAVVLVFEDNKVYGCDSNGTPFELISSYPYTKLLKNIMNAFIEYSRPDSKITYGGLLGELNPGCHNTSEFQLHGGVCASWAKYLLLLLSINPHVKTPAIFDYHAIKGYTEKYLLNRAILIVLYLFEHGMEGLRDPSKNTKYLHSLK